MDISTSASASALADEFVAHRLATEHDWALWNGTMTHLERWDDLTDAALAERDRQLTDFAARATTLTPRSPMERLLLETIEYSARAQREHLVWREMNWLNHAAGILPSIFTFLPRFPLVTPTDGERYVAKVHNLATFLDQWSDRLRASVAHRRAPIRHLVEQVMAMIEGHLSAPLSSGPLARQAAPRELDRESSGAWQTAVGRALDDDVAPAMSRFLETLRTTVLPAARPDDQPGLVHLEGGAEHYESLIWAHTTLDISGQDVHDIGLRQIAALEDEYRRVAGPLLGTDDIDEIYRRLREDDALRYHDADTIVADATRALAKAAAAMGDWFGRLPAAPCVAQSIEQGALAFYSPPARNGSKPGTFFFNTADPTMWATYQLEAVTYHESIPGHHLQFSIAQEVPDLHPLLGRYYITAYGEGWGLYTERLADEMGLYSSPLDRVGMLAADSMRACRLVVDTGMHALGWSRDAAIAYMHDHSPMSTQQIVNEIDRYIGDPGQAVSYMIGRLEIDRIRHDAEARCGSTFDIRAFHDVVLGSGSLTLASLRRLVDDWVTTRS